MTDPLRTALDAYLGAFPEGVLEFEVRGLDDLPVHLHSAAVLPGPGRPGGSGLGYGLTPAQARVGALGEMAEVVLSARAVTGRARVEGSFADVLDARGPDGVADPRTLCLPAGCDWTPQRPLQWLPMRRTRDDAEVLVPAELVASSGAELTGPPPPGGWLTTAITNGQGAHTDAAAALAHALLELLQRDGNAVRFRALDRGVLVDLEGLRDPESLGLLADLDRAGVQVQVKLADVSHDVVSLYVVGSSRDGTERVPLMVTACGEAASPDRDEAVRKALQEFVSARARKAFMHGPLDGVRAATPPGYLDTWFATHPPAPQDEEPRALTEMRRWLALDAAELVDLVRDPVLGVRSTVPLSSLPTTAGVHDPAQVLRRLEADGLDVLVDTRRAGGVVGVKAVVPTLEVETLSYGRIGERGVRRLLEDGSPLVVVGDDPGGWAGVHLTPEATERLGGPAWFDRTGADRVLGSLYPLYREPSRHVAQLQPGADPVR